jgi:hypothetical protein
MANPVFYEKWMTEKSNSSRIIRYAKAQAFSGRSLTEPAVLLSKEARINKLTPSELVREVRWGSKAAAYRCQFTPDCKKLVIKMNFTEKTLNNVLVGNTYGFLKQEAKVGNVNAEKDICLFVPLAEPNFGFDLVYCNQAVKEFPNSPILRKDLDTLQNSWWLKLAAVAAIF